MVNTTAKFLRPPEIRRPFWFFPALQRPTEAKYPPSNEGEGEMIAPETTTPTIDWMLEATCRNEGIPTSLFFSEDLGEIAQAKAICATCPAMVPCLEGAIARAEPWGVWGGQLLLNGKVLAVKRRRGRPRKHPRPEDEVPMLPVPEHLAGFVRSA